MNSFKFVRSVPSRLLLLLALTLATACSKDEENESLPTPPETEKKVPFLVNVMFAPGQLGDKGYADNVMEGVNALDALDDLLGGDSLDVHFIAPRNLEDAQRWMNTSGTAYSSQNYKRRLLVLTEPYMTDLFNLIKDVLQPTDEVLILKMEKDDIAQVAQQFSLGNRVHGLNISASAPTRRFCQYIRHWIEHSEFPVPPFIQVPVYRLYEEVAYPYRDGMMEAIQQEMGDRIQFVHIGLSSLEDIGIVMDGSSQSMVEAAYEAAQIAQVSVQSSGCPFVLVDLGAGNAGWDYYLLSQAYSSSPLRTLILDAQQATRLDRFFINRKFGTALKEWVQDWMSKPAGAMVPQVTHSGDDYYTDNIYAIN